VDNVYKQYIRLIIESEENSNAEVEHLYNKIVVGGNINAVNLKKLFKYFHLSSNFVNDVFKAAPPKEPFTDNSGKVIEDDFTKRISLAPSIYDAYQALTNFRQYVYAADIINFGGDDINPLVVKKQIKVCKKQLGQDYGKNFSFKEWLVGNKDKFVGNDIEGVDELLDNFDRPSDLPDKFRNQWFGCVPDAEETGEIWSLQDLNLYYLGKLSRSISSVKLSRVGQMVVKNALKYFNGLGK
jgi:hypothetical protein